MSQCKFCGKEFEPRKIGGHTVGCDMNPRKTATREKIVSKQLGRPLSEVHRMNITNSVNKRIKEDSWHLSFSKSRTHVYKGIKFHGLWEVKFAMNLDDKNVEWRRPTEKFQYEFEGKTRNYTPDFWIPELESYVEIKGYTTSKDEAKWKQFPLKLIILKGEDLVRLGILEYNQIKKLAE
jgi:hypothetical protein